jgi:hypothetical protein
MMKRAIGFSMMAGFLLLACAVTPSSNSVGQDEQASTSTTTTPWLGEWRADELPPQPTSVPNDSSDNQLLATCSDFVDDGKVNRSTLVPQLYTGNNPARPWKWKCHQTSFGPECCGVGTDDGTPASWGPFAPCADGRMAYIWPEEIGASHRYYDTSDKLLKKSIHWHQYALASMNPTGGGKEVLFYNDFVETDVYPTPGDDTKGKEFWTGVDGNPAVGGNNWPLVGNTEQPVVVDQGTIVFDIATFNILAQTGRWDQFNPNFDFVGANCAVIE